MKYDLELKNNDIVIEDGEFLFSTKAQHILQVIRNRMLSYRSKYKIDNEIIFDKTEFIGLKNNEETLLLIENEINNILFDLNDSDIDITVYVFKVDYEEILIKIIITDYTSNITINENYSFSLTDGVANVYV